MVIVDVLLLSITPGYNISIRRHSTNHYLGNDADRNHLQSRLHTRRRLKAHPNEQIIRDRLSRAKHQDLRRSGAARQLAPGHGAHGRILRRVRIRHVIEVQQLHGLSVIRGGDEAVLIHDQVLRCVEGEDDGLGARGAVEADDGTVAVVVLGVGSVQGDAVQDDARVFKLEDEGWEGACALGDGGGSGDSGGGGWGFGGGGGVGGADAGAGARVAGCTGTG